MIRGKIKTAFDAECAFGTLIAAIATCPPQERRIAAIRLRHDADAHGRDKAIGKMALAIADALDPSDDE